MKFNNYQEMYAAIQACHGGNYWEDEDGDEWGYEELMAEIFATEDAEGPEATFGSWSCDTYQCGNNLFCNEYTHNNSVDGKTHVLYFYEDESDTIEEDKVFDSEEKAFNSTIDYDFLNALTPMFGKDHIK
jgi:hypothetical protein